MNDSRRTTATPLLAYYALIFHSCHFAGTCLTNARHRESLAGSPGRDGGRVNARVSAETWKSGVDGIVSIEHGKSKDANVHVHSTRAGKGNRWTTSRVSTTAIPATANGSTVHSQGQIAIFPCSAHEAAGLLSATEQRAGTQNDVRSE